MIQFTKQSNLYRYESNKTNFGGHSGRHAFLYGITTPPLPAICPEVGDFFTSKNQQMKNLQKVFQSALEAQNNLPDRITVQELIKNIRGEGWISEHEAIQYFLNKCSELNLPTIQSTYDKLLKALCKGTESQDEHFLLYLRSQQDALIAFCEKTDQDNEDPQVTERYFRFEVLDKYDQESIDFWAAFT